MRKWGVRPTDTPHAVSLVGLFVEGFHPRGDVGHRRLGEVKLIFFEHFPDLLLHLLRVGAAEVLHQVVTHFLEHGHQIGGNAEGHIGFGLVLGGKFLGLHLREEEHFLNGRLTGEQHHEAVDADADARGGGHAVLERAEEVLVDDHRFVIALVGQAHLIHETLFLVDGVVELRVGVGQLLAVDHQLETLGQAGFAAVHLRERRHFDGIVGDEGGLDELAFAGFAEDFVDQLALAHALIDLDAELLSHAANFFFVHFAQIIASLLLDGVENGQATIGGFETDGLAVDHRFGRTVHSGADAFEHALGEVHHPVVVLILHIEFHAGELGVVRAVHALVAEVLADFVHAFKAAHDQALEVELGGDAAIHLLVERIEVRHEGARRSTAGDVLERGGFHFRVARFVENGAEGADGLGTLVERVLHLRIHNEINVTTAVAQFGILKRVIDHTVLFFRRGERLEALGQHRDFASVYRHLAGLRAKHKALHAHEVAEVEEFFHHAVVERLVLTGADVVARDVDLDAAAGVEQFEERSLTHHAASHHTAGDAHLAGRVVVLKIGNDFVAEGVGGVFGCGVGVNAQRAKFGKRIAACNLLFAEFEDVHAVVVCLGPPSAMRAARARNSSEGCLQRVGMRIFCLGQKYEFLLEHLAHNVVEVKGNDQGCTLCETVCRFVAAKC